MPNRSGFDAERYDGGGVDDSRNSKTRANHLHLSAYRNIIHALSATPQATA